MSVSNDVLLETAGKIAAGDDVDWNSASITTSTNVRIISNLRTIATLAEQFENPPNDRKSPPRRDHLFTWGHLQVIERIAKGGFGEVFRAFDPILCRDVALKLRGESAGNDAEASLFIEEARRIARVRHSNVLAVHGADVRNRRVGLWSDLLSGRTLEAELDERQTFSANAALAVASEIASALHAIREAGLVHGDVKASNVMLEDDGRVVLMDFGAGRDLAIDGAGSTFASPLSAAPELFDGDIASTASDQYAFGVLLHRMLIGTYPSNADNIDELVEWHDLRGDSRDELPCAAKGPLGKLANALLQVDPESRPLTNDTLARLKAILELPAHRKRQMTAAVIMLSIVIGTIAATSGFMAARNSDAEARAAATELTAVNDFLQDTLASAGPRGAGRQTTVLELMEKAAENVSSDLAAHPAERARTFLIIGRTYLDMYEWEKAEAALAQSLQLREEALGARHPDTLLSRAFYAAALSGLDRTDEAEVVLVPVFDSLPDLPLEHEVQAQSRIVRARLAYDNEEFDRSREFYGELLTFRHDAAWHDDLLYRVAQSELGKMLFKLGDYESGMAVTQDLYDWSIETNGEKNQSTINARLILAMLYDGLGQPTRTLELLKKNLEVTQEWLGDDDRHTHLAMANVAEASLRTGLYEEALQIQARVLARKGDFYPATHFNSLGPIVTYATILTALGRYGEAEQQLADVMPIAEEYLGSKHYLVLESRFHYADLLYKSGRPDEAIAYGQVARATIASALGDDHMFTLRTDAIIGASYAAIGDYELSEQILRETLGAQQQTIGEHSPDTLTTELYLARTLRLRDSPDSNNFVARLLEKSRQHLGAQHPQTRAVENELAYYAQIGLD